ncbi:sensor histidine kinase [Massilia glaciei]|uniref:histidine kinase n=1 Tax=Massilia glaciei TaxID=1524097 RepID=A0A2U2HMM2_9BURK|nr:sensor histidine kinase [Massilia glaciei]PWF48665.1 histidine kinase [Massilia glaciei]
MYSLLPAIVSLLFLGYGVYVLASRGLNRSSGAFFLVCATTFAWQFTWAILFQVREEALAVLLAKIGYLLILFLPTTLYHFVVELTRRGAELRHVKWSYAVAAMLALAMVPGDAVVAGVQQFHFGYYPRAGPLHPLHLLQTALVVLRALQLLARQQRLAVSTDRLRLRYCLASVLIYSLAAVDYLCNYGLAMYPPGVLLIAVSLGIIAQAMARHELLANPMMLAATIAHEMRTPLATIRNQARVLAKGLPELIAGYEHAVAQGVIESGLRAGHLDYLRELARDIEAEVYRSNFIVDMVLASACGGTLCTDGFARHAVGRCVEEALLRYPFEGGARARVRLRAEGEFDFHGCDTLLVYVLYNLLKNALSALAAAGRGDIEISFERGAEHNRLRVTDTGNGIARDVLPLVFDPYYTTRPGGGGTGMGLAFCKRVLGAFGGSIACDSVEGQYTTMVLAFPALARGQRREARPKVQFA